MVTETGSVSSSVVDGHVEAAVLPVDPPPRRINENRRSNKPIMEKRRRARINNCLNELKTLILDAMKKDPARHSKLEKADILEMTVKHLQNLQRQQAAMSAVSDPAIFNKYKAGFGECVTEVGRFPGLDASVKRRLLQHLTNCLTQGKPDTTQVQVHILPSLPEVQQTAHQAGIILSNGNGTGVQLLPTRLPNGDIALVLPTSSATASTSSSTSAASPVPLLVPIPSRTASASSMGSSSSQSPEPAPIDLHVHQQKPLSLVMRKLDDGHEEQPWRPWNS